APRDPVSSCRSSASRARSESRWLLTDTYSPDAIASPPANIPARPAVRIAVREDVAPATPTTRPAVDTTPSFAPRTAARSQLSRVARPPPCGSRCPGALTRASRIAITSRISRPAWQPGDQGLRSSCWSRPRGPGSRRGLCRRQDLLSTAPRAGGAGSRFHWAGGAIGHTAAGRAGRDDRSGVRAGLIVAAFGITRNLFVLFTSNAFAVLGLRARYFLLAGSIYRFTYPDKVLPCCWVHRREDARLLRPSRAGTVSLAVIVAVWGGSRRRPAARSAPCSPDRQNRCTIERDHQPPGGLRDFVRHRDHRSRAGCDLPGAAQRDRHYRTRRGDRGKRRPAHRAARRLRRHRRVPRRQPLLPARPPLRAFRGTQVLRHRERTPAARLGLAFTAAVRGAGHHRLPVHPRRPDSGHPELRADPLSTAPVPYRDRRRGGDLGPLRLLRWPARRQGVRGQAMGRFPGGVRRRSRH